MTATIADLAEQTLRRLNVAVVALADRPALTVVVPVATIATNALVELGIIASDETPSPTDAALALAKANAVHDSLAANANVSWIADQVPQGVSEEYAKLTALVMASSFGKTADPAQLPVLEARVRKFSLVQRAPALATDAVQGVHNDLAMRGLVRWSAQDIPDAVGDCYVFLAADALGPLFGVQTSPRDAIAAMMSIARYIALPTSGERIRADYY